MSIRDLIRRERWAVSRARHREAVALYLAGLVPEPLGGWAAVIEDAWRRAHEDSERRLREWGVA